MPGVHVKIDEIDYPAETQTIDHIAERSADDEAERQRRPFAAHAIQPNAETSRDDQGKSRDQPNAGTAVALKQAKANTAIFNRHKIEKTDQFDTYRRVPEIIPGNPFGQLIENEHQRRNRRTEANHAGPTRARRATVGLLRCRLVEVNRIGAAGADVGVGRHGADIGQYLPATGAFFSAGQVNHDADTRHLVQ